MRLFSKRKKYADSMYTNKFFLYVHKIFGVKVIHCEHNLKRCLNVLVDFHGYRKTKFPMNFLEIFCLWKFAQVLNSTVMMNIAFKIFCHDVASLVRWRVGIQILSPRLSIDCWYVERKIFRKSSYFMF